MIGEQTPAQILARIESKRVHKKCVEQTRDDDDYYNRNRNLYLSRIRAATDSLRVLDAQRHNADNIIAMLDSDIEKLQNLLKVAEKQQQLNKLAAMEAELRALTAALGDKTVLSGGVLAGEALKDADN